jgi:hypothetical protein
MVPSPPYTYYSTHPITHFGFTLTQCSTRLGVSLTQCSTRLFLLAPWYMYIFPCFLCMSFATCTFPSYVSPALRKQNSGLIIKGVPPIKISTSSPTSLYRNTPLVFYLSPVSFSYIVTSGEGDSPFIDVSCDLWGCDLCCTPFSFAYVSVYTAHNWSHKPPLTCL